MNSLKTLPLAALLGVTGVATAHAQASSSVPFAQTEVAFAAGLAHTLQVDATASPLQFGGQGYDVAGRLARSAGRFALSAAFSGGVRKLSAATGSGGVGEHVTEAQLALGLRRALGTSAVASSFAVGADLGGSLRVTAHHYADPNRSVSDFVIAAITLGPSASWQRQVPGGAAKVLVSVPLLGVVDHPYSDERSTQSHIVARFATISTLRGANTVLSYSPAVTQRLGLEYSYHLRVLNYADVQPVRSVSQSLSVGFVKRFGTEPR